MTTPTTNHPFAGLRVALTGGTSGLGLALLRALREHGAQVAFVARDAERVARTAAAHPGSRGIAGDVSDKQQTHGLALQLASAFGGVDLLIHNAAALGPVGTPLADTECEDFSEVLDTNLMGPFRLTKALLGSLSAAAREGRPARVLFIGSECATEAYPRWGAYSTAKAAARMLARIWDQELAPAGIRVLEHDPGNMDTPMHARALPDTDPATLKRPSQSAAEILALLAASMRGEPAAAATTSTETTPPLSGVDHLHVYVQDRAAAERWYAGALGLRRVEALAHWAADGGPLTLADAADRVHLALFERPPQPNRATIALGTDAAGFVAWRRHLARWLGAAPQAVDHGVSWSIYFSDPDGNPYEITSYQHGPIAAALAVQRPADARLLEIGSTGTLRHHARTALPTLLRPGDLLIANDAATLPASLHGVHQRTGAAIEVRLAGRPTLAVDAVRDFSAVVFGAGDHRTRTEDRPPPPPLQPDDVLQLGPHEEPTGRSRGSSTPSGGGGGHLAPPGGPMIARVRWLLGHPRLVVLRFDGTPGLIWAGLARHGRPVQYAHLPEPLALWDSWTRIAAQPVAFEPPSAGFLLDWALLDALRERGIGFATLTHAAGLSSTGDAALDARLPLAEPYHLPAATVQAIARTRAAGGRIVALGTTVTRALEHAASLGPLCAGEALADNRLGPGSTLRVVDAIVSGTHEPGTSHHALLHAFAPAACLARMDETLQRGGYRGHEYGDSVLLWRAAGGAARHQPAREALAT